MRAIPKIQAPVIESVGISQDVDQTTEAREVIKEERMEDAEQIIKAEISSSDVDETESIPEQTTNNEHK